MKLRRTPAVLLAALVVALLTPAPATALFCTPVATDKNSPHRFIAAVASSLVFANAAASRTASVRNDSETWIPDMMIGWKTAKGDLDCAREQVAPFATSTVESIAISATRAALLYGKMANLQTKAVAELARALDSLSKGQIEIGSVVERQAELSVVYDDAKRELISVVILSTYAVVDRDAKTGTMSRLKLTDAQRNDVLRELVESFGPGIKGGMKAGQPLFTAAAAALYAVVGDPQRKPRDAK